MEIQTLLLSNVLPTDIVLNNIYNHLWRIKSPLTKDLKESIVNDHFRFKKIVMSYYNSEIYSRRPESQFYFLDYLLNDMIDVLNDNYMMIDGVSPNLSNECPWMTIDYLMDDMDGVLNSKLYDIWKIMTPEKKQIMYNSI